MRISDWSSVVCSFGSVPGLPTVPFVLLSAYAAARGSRRLHAWLRRHRQFGPMIRDWQSQGAVSRRAQWLATVMMAACAAILFLTAPQAWMAAPGPANKEGEGGRASGRARGW